MLFIPMFVVLGIEVTKRERLSNGDSKRFTMAAIAGVVFMVFFAIAIVIIVDCLARGVGFSGIG